MSHSALQARTRAALAALAALGLLAPTAAAQREPIPIEKSFTNKQDGAIWVVEGRQRIRSNVKLASLRACLIVGAGEGAVLEVEGGLDLRAATGGHVVIDGVWIEPLPGCKDLVLLNCNFEGQGGLRTSQEGPADLDIILSSSRFLGESRLDLGLVGGKLAIMGCEFLSPAAIRGLTTEKQKRNALEVILTGCAGKERGFRGGLRVEGVKEATLRNVDLAGEESVLADCRKLVFDGNQARSTRVEFRQSESKSFGGTKISNTDFRCDELLLFQPATSGDPQRVRLDSCWFDGRMDPAYIKSSMLSDSEKDPANGVLATFAKIQEVALGFGGGVQ